MLIIEPILLIYRITINSMGLAIGMIFALAMLGTWAIPQAVHDSNESKVEPTNKGA
jgi:hypothetical protein